MLFFLLLYMFYFSQNVTSLIKEVLTLVIVGNVTICNFSFPSWGSAFSNTLLFARFPPLPRPQFWLLSGTRLVFQERAWCLEGKLLTPSPSASAGIRSQVSALCAGEILCGSAVSSLLSQKTVLPIFYRFPRMGVHASGTSSMCFHCLPRSCYTSECK